MISFGCGCIIQQFDQHRHQGSKSRQHVLQQDMIYGTPPGDTLRAVWEPAARAPHRTGLRLPNLTGDKNLAFLPFYTYFVLFSSR